MSTEQPAGRDAAWQLLCEYTEKDALRKHALSVEASMRYYARLFGEDEELWGITGLLHDFDYERYPDTHPLRGADELRARGYREDVVEAILGHGDHTGVARTSLLAKVVYACDEMTGFIIAVTYVRPNRSLDEVDLRSVTKKMKDKGFARQVPRDQLEKGAVEIGVPFDEHVLNVVEGLKTIRGELGL